MTIIDESVEEKRRLQHAETSSVAMTTSTLVDPPIRPQSLEPINEASSSTIRKSRRRAGPSYSSLPYTSSTFHNEPRRSYGFTYPELVQYFTYLLIIASVLVFAVFTIKTVELLGETNRLAQQSVQLASDVQQLFKAGGILSLMSVCEEVQQDVQASTRIPAVYSACNHMYADSTMVQNLIEVLGVQTATATVPSFFANDTPTTSLSATSTSTSTTSPSATTQTPSVNSTTTPAFTGGANVPPTQLASGGQTQDGSSDTTDGSFRVTVGGIGAIVLFFGIAGAIIYERSIRKRERLRDMDRFYKEKV